jgi:hypothetical protein
MRIIRMLDLIQFLPQPSIRLRHRTSKHLNHAFLPSLFGSLQQICDACFEQLDDFARGSGAKWVG